MGNMTEQTKYGVVLLPPEDVWDWLRQLNMTVSADMAHPLIVLGDEQKPHASLAHMYVDSPQALVEPLTEVIQPAHPLRVLLSAFSIDTIGENTWSSVLIQDTPELHDLHVNVMDTIVPFETRPSTYREEFAYDKFFPHFTIGVNAIRTDISFSPRQVTIGRIALCEIDKPYSTCGNIIYEWTVT